MRFPLQLLRRLRPLNNSIMSDSKSSSSSSDLHWSFGFGSNMNVEFVEKHKGVKVIDHTPAILRDYQLIFDYIGLPKVEPSYANVREEEGEEVHGLAFGMDKENAEKMTSVEEGYESRLVTLEAYDGRKLNGFVLIREPLPRPLTLLDAPSKRYMNIIITGARKAGLKPSYLEKLEKMPIYEPPEWLLKIRSQRPPLSDLPPITADELAKHKEDHNLWWCMMGYVVEPAEVGHDWMAHFRGKDTTTGMYQIHNELSWYNFETNDGRPPYPLLKDMDEAELECLNKYLDHYQTGSSVDGVTNMGKIIGHLVEFREAQESGVTTYVKPTKKK